MSAADAAEEDLTRRPRSGRAHFHILMVASEVAPWAKTGGLADVLSGLPEALTDLGHEVTTVLPRYRTVDLPAGEIVSRRITVGSFEYDVVFHIAQLSARQKVVFVECPALFDRESYYGSGGRDYADNDRRFAALAVAALEFVQHHLPSPVDIVHAHDWQAGLVPVWLRTQPQRWSRLAHAGLVFTIHNLAYQGLFPASTVPALGLGWQIFTMEGAEFWGKLSFLKAGITFSDLVTTVSPTYARETLDPETGAGLEGVLHSKGDRYVGIANGIDARIWNPRTDRLLPAYFDASNLSGKRTCKRALLERFHLPMGDDAMTRPVIAMVSRLVEQKGVDLVLDTAASLVKLDAAWIFVGSGDPRFQRGLQQLASAHPSRVGTFIGFDEALAHQVEAGADMFLMPSRFEPCGLNQMYSLRYGAVPIVRAVGGLDDTIQPYTARARHANGFKFHEASPEALLKTVQQAVRVFHSDREAWDRLVRQGMREDHSWETSAREYVKVYRRARQEAGRRTEGGPTR